MNDEAAIDRVIRDFMGVFSNKGGAKPNLDLIYDLFIREGLIIRNSGPVPEVFNLEQFTTKLHSGRTGEAGVANSLDVYVRGSSHPPIPQE